MAGSGSSAQGDVEQVQSRDEAEDVLQLRDEEAAEGSVLRNTDHVENVAVGSALGTSLVGHEAAGEKDNQEVLHLEEDMSIQERQGSSQEVSVQGQVRDLKTVFSQVAGGSSLDEQMQRSSKEVPGTQGSKEDVSTHEQGLEGSVEDIGTQERGPQGSVEDIGTQKQGLQGSVEDVVTQEQGLQGSVEDVGTQEQGLQGSVKDVGTQEQGLKGSVEYVGTQEQGPQGSNEDVPSVGQGSQGSREQVSTGGLAEEHASESQAEGKSENLKQEVDKNETGTETVSAEDDQDVKNAVELLGKLEIEENSDAASDMSSSIESTANSGAVHSQDDKAVSGDDQGRRRWKRRVDLGHHFVRDIVKIQHDRDQFEKQCQMKKQESPARNLTQASSRTNSSSSEGHDDDRISSVDAGGRRRSSAQETPRSSTLVTPRRSVRRQQGEVKKVSTEYSSYMSTQDVRYEDLTSQRNYEKGKQPVRPLCQPDLPVQGQYKQPVVPLYRPPSRRDSDECIQVRGLPVATKVKNDEALPGNLKITINREGREVTEVPKQPQVPGYLHGSKTSGNLPSSFEFKGKAVEMHPIGDTSVAEVDDNRRPRRNRNRNRNRNRSGSLLARTFQDAEISSTPRSMASTGTERSFNGALEVNARRIQRSEVPPSIYPVDKLPPKDKPFAAENTNSAKWSDMVDDEAEQSPRFDVGLEDKSHRDRARQRKPRHKKASAAAAATEPSAASVGQHGDKDTSRKSVWERLGPRVPESARTVYFEETNTRSRLEGIRMRSERQYFCNDGEPEPDLDSGDAVVGAGAAYKDSKQKRSRRELYVPRRGGAGRVGGGSP